MSLSKTMFISTARTAFDSYTEVILLNPAYSAILYAKRLPYVIWSTLLTGVILVLSFCLLPWFSIDLGDVVNLSHHECSAFDIAGRGAAAFTGCGPTVSLFPQIG